MSRALVALQPACSRRGPLLAALLTAAGWRRACVARKQMQHTSNRAASAVPANQPTHTLAFFAALVRAFERASASLSLRLSVHACTRKTVLGRFVFALNRFCKEAYSMEYDVADYWIYEFAKVRVLCAWVCV